MAVRNHLDASAFAAIPGLDAADGLRRASENTVLYLDLLRQFADGQSNAAERVLADLARGDRDAAVRTAHTVKGVAGNIGASAVHAAATELESLLRKHAEGAHVERARSRLAAELDALNASLTAFLTRHAPAAAADDGAVADPEAVTLFAKTLLPLLEDSDPTAIDVVESGRPALRALFKPDELPAFERLVAGYGFDEALARLRSVLETDPGARQ